MAYPRPHSFPAEVPLWTLADHQLTAGERVQITPFEQGEDRHRDTRRFTVWMATVVTPWLTQAQFDRFYYWFEDELQQGTQPFNAPVHSLDGAGVQWWEAQIIATPGSPPYRVTARRARYRIATELILLDGPYAGVDAGLGAGPRPPAPSLAGRISVDIAHTASFPPITGMSGRIEPEAEAHLRVDTRLAGRIEPEPELQALQQPVSNARLIDGAIGYRLIDGDPTSKRIRD